ncbi:MAG: tRNA lysidine(34) synthetase TilS [Desulfobacteraceae bacterium]|nr:tRNA lysidine(34) synthetase TilS [Desulfobacteraceae bacterium]
MKQNKNSNLDVFRDHPFIRSIKKTIFAHAMLGRNESVLLGVSGGADSVSLLYGLVALSEIHEWHIGVAHLDHGLRGSDSNADARYVEAVAQKLGLPFYKEKTDVNARCLHEGLSLEEAGRKARYEFFNKIADQQGYNKIAVGHQRQDAAEQVLLNLLRGAGAEGLGGLAPVRGRVIRPLIETHRREIEQFLHKNDILYCYDKSNADNRFTRNRVRNCLIPELETFNPAIVDSLFRLSTVMREENEWIEAVVEPLYEAAILYRNTGPCEVVISVKRISRLHRAVLRRLLRRAICEVKGDLGRIEYQHIEDCVSLVYRQASYPAQIHLPGKIRVIRHEEKLEFRRGKKTLRSFHSPLLNLKTVPFTYTVERIEEGPRTVWIDEVQCGFVFSLLRIHDISAVCLRNEQTALMDLEQVEFPMVIRNPRPGDCFKPLGMHGSVKLKDFFVNNKVGPDKRRRIPVIESGGRIIWIAGMRIDERVKITDTTKNVLKISFFSNNTEQTSKIPRS